MTWWETIPAFAVVLTVGIAPGLLLSAMLGLRGIALLGSAPAFSVTTVTLASIAAPFFGAAWGLAPIAGTTVVLLIVIAVFRLLWHRLRPQPAFAHPPVRLLTWAALGIGVAAIAITVRFIVAFGEPENISQTYDNIFHLNALRYVLDSGNASSLTLGGFNIENPAAGTFYPAGWHALTAASASITGVSIPVAINLTSILIGAVYWPLGCVFLVRTILGPRAIAIVGAGVLSAAFGAFPYGLVDFGVLYPYLLGVSLLPAALAYAVIATRLSDQPEMRTSRAWFALFGVVPGITLAHPSATMAFVALSSILVVVGAHRMYKRLVAAHASTRKIRLLLVGTALVLAAYLGAWLVVRVSVVWEPIRTVAQALGEVLTNATNGLPIAIVATALVIVGILQLRQQPLLRWLILNFSIVGILYIAAAAMPHSLLQSLLVGTWYGDSHRLGSLLPIVALPLATLGLVRVYDAIRTREPTKVSAKVDARSRQRSLAITAVALLLATQGYSLHVATLEARSNYVITDDPDDEDYEAPLLTADELDVLEHVADYVPKDAVVAGSPWTGAGLVYAIADREAMLPHVGGFDSAESRLIGERLRDAASYTSVCDALATLEVGYALDFGTREVHGEEHNFDGLTRLATSQAVEPLYTSGDVGLYKITACD
ncbi:hypothetical protein ESZ53_05840 [Salinibacterium sp. UTAS2018]|uniref:DUF6541 family protein n=1 Tax=Salinibacterium sp. UTAS2018 TaxID=2508880 RepID=UPI0010095B25|nr:DUF6541 family protein [Salinibacterium sp. UTAS2018]QAV69996.1 hypothetical protein ESZ53_05840 [Salinibacterium sp. UTAS2018]